MLILVHFLHHLQNQRQSKLLKLHEKNKKQLKIISRLTIMIALIVMQPIKNKHTYKCIRFIGSINVN